MTAIADMEAELMRRLKQSARLGSLQVRVAHRIDTLHRKLDQQRAAERRIRNANVVKLNARESRR